MSQASIQLRRPAQTTATAAFAPVLLCGGLAAAIALRVGIAGSARTTSAPAGLAFGAALVLLAVAAGWRPRVTPRTAWHVVVGIAGGAALLVVPLALHLHASPLRFASPAAALPLWAAVVTLVACAEEVVLRGALMSALLRRVRPETAVAVAAVAFAALHVPLYGWVAIPLDLAVGVWLGGLRLASGGVAAPAAAHTVADLATWWLR
jgi:membrane protease YdiL (CAAX protease family)